MTLLSFAPSHPIKYRKRPSRRNLFFRNNPLTNIVETNDSFIIQLAIPGKTKEEINIDLEDAILHISAKGNEDSAESYTRREFDYSEISKSFKIPDSVNQAEISAKMENGILFLTLLKKEDAKTLPPKSITIK
ncbi:MAG: Hsp20/alpha crystallin family protein [Bacteroidia bacterium]|nr:Hsp20/alpha crystallin family protein [Bacteroidia bacterium]